VSGLTVSFDLDLNNPETKLAPLLDLFKPDPELVSLAPLFDLRKVLLEANRLAPLGTLWTFPMISAMSMHAMG
jgi:hypothetical protein